MSKLLLATLTALLPLLAFAQSSVSAYQSAVITSVKLHQSAEESKETDALYDVSVQVGRTIYVVLTPSPSPSGTIVYAIGREILVRVGENMITWNDIMGQSHEVPIVSRIPLADASESEGDERRFAHRH